MKKKRNIVFPFILIVGFLLWGLICFYPKEKELLPEERNTIACLRELQFECIAPNSFLVYDDAIYIEYLFSDADTSVYIFFDCGHQNSIGGMDRNIYVYKDWNYYATLEDSHSNSNTYDAYLVYQIYLLGGRLSTDENGNTHGIKSCLFIDINLLNKNLIKY